MRPAAIQMAKGGRKGIMKREWARLTWVEKMMVGTITQRSSSQAVSLR
jgi:hypothetical protein